jgi:hypothetical protein
VGARRVRRSDPSLLQFIYSHQRKMKSAVKWRKFQIFGKV